MAARGSGMSTMPAVLTSVPYALLFTYGSAIAGTDRGNVRWSSTDTAAAAGELLDAGETGTSSHGNRH